MIFNVAKLNFFFKIDTINLHNKLYNICRNMDITIPYLMIENGS